jgi:excisionase family DNA binding protein
MSDFLTEVDLANELGVTEEKVREWRRRYGWPHIKIGRQVRFTAADVRAIAAKHRVEGERVTALPGQTALSAARSR